MGMPPSQRSKTSKDRFRVAALVCNHDRLRSGWRVVLPLTICRKKLRLLAQAHRTHRPHGEGCSEATFAGDLSEIRMTRVLEATLEFAPFLFAVVTERHGDGRFNKSRGSARWLVLENPQRPMVFSISLGEREGLDASARDFWRA